MKQEIKRILLIGAGGHCRSVIDSLLSLGSYEEIGLIARRTVDGTEKYQASCSRDILSGYPVLGTDSDLEHLYQEGYKEAFITVGSIGDYSVRKTIYRLLKHIGYTIPNIIDASSAVSSYALLGEGIYVGKKAVINANSKIGNCAIINTAAVIEHECKIGDFVHVAPGSILSGNITIESGTHIGAGCVIRQGLHIGADSMIGMGSIVIKNIGSNITAYGNPCIEVKHE